MTSVEIKRSGTLYLYHMSVEGYYMNINPLDIISKPCMQYLWNMRLYRSPTKEIQCLIHAIVIYFGLNPITKEWKELQKCLQQLNFNETFMAEKHVEKGMVRKACPGKHVQQGMPRAIRKERQKR